MRPEILNALYAPVSRLDGIGPKLEKSLTRLLTGNESGNPARIIELLFHTPHSIIDRRNQPNIGDAVEGIISTFRVYVGRHLPPPRGNKKIPYRIEVHDDTGSMSLVFFHISGNWLSNAMPEGELRYVSGKPEWFNGKLNIVHPDHMVTEAEFQTMPLVEPVYPLAAGVSSKVMARTVRAAIVHVRHVLKSFQTF